VTGQCIAMFEPFDFDAWAGLWHKDPDAFEAARRVAVETLISKCGDQVKLRRLQWRVDAERRRAKVPLKACLVLSEMMWNEFYNLQRELVPLTGISVRRQRPKPPVLAYRAPIIPFPKEPPGQENKV
jgi:hypothetical protein